MSTKRPRPTTPLAHATVPTPLGVAHLFGTTRGLLTIALPDEPYAAAVALAERLVGPILLTADDTILSEAAAQLAAYFAGALHTFTADLRSTRHAIPASRLAAIAGDPVRRDAHIQRPRGGDRSPRRSTGGRGGQCREPAGPDHPLPSPGRSGWHVARPSLWARDEALADRPRAGASPTVPRTPAL